MLRRSVLAAGPIVLALAVSACAPDRAPDPAITASASPSGSAPPSASAPGGASAGASASATPALPSEAPAPTPGATPSPSPRGELQAIVDRLGVADFELQGAAEFITQWGVGTRDGSEVRVYEFASEDDFLGYLDSVAAFGVTIDDFARRGLYAVAPSDRSQLESIRATLG